VNSPLTIVGGSLSGLSCALALSTKGFGTRVLERAPGSPVEGAGLGVELSLLGRVTGRPERLGQLAVLHDRPRDSVAYHDIRVWMRALAIEDPLIDLDEHTDVLAAADSEQGAHITTKDGDQPAALVIGADGVRSTVRHSVDPQNPISRYAGYVLWRSLVEEHDVPQASRILPAEDTMRISSSARYRLVAYAVPGGDGSVSPGHRRLSVAWYDASRNEQLAQLGVIDGHTTRGSLYPDRLPAELREQLRIDAAVWPSPWDEAIDRALDQQRLFGFPIAEYLPERLTRGRLATIGDAAHAASPMTGSGFHNALLDAEALAGAIASHGPTPAALHAYQGARLSGARALVLSGQAWGQSYLRSQP
jgi:2-polyprenyl-6-methoxyphenol hydroxylase-like FAD-dependent oxidoreductase